MPVMDNANYTYSGGVRPGMVEYYERKLIANAKPKMVYSRDAQKRNLPRNNGKVVQFRQFVPYEASTEPLQEGVSPAGQELRQLAKYALLRSYGRHIELTDEMDMYHLDTGHKELSDLLTDQALLSLDTICRDVIMSGLNVQFAGGKNSRAELTAQDKLTNMDIKKAVRQLRRANCQPFEDGYYHAIVHPDTVYDLTDDPLWIDVAKYQDKERIEKGEIGILQGVKFFTTTNAKTFDNAQYLYDEVTELAVTNVDPDAMNASYTGELDDVAVNKLTGKLVAFNDSENSATVIEKIDLVNKRIHFRWCSPTAASATAIVPYGNHDNDIDVYGTVIYGKDAFGDINLDGGENVKIIINPPGSAGAADPLEQRGTIAWKIAGFACVILQDAFIIRIEHTATA